MEGRPKTDRVIVKARPSVHEMIHAKNDTTARNEEALNTTRPKQITRASPTTTQQYEGKYF
jgi:hypothetical protein